MTRLLGYWFAALCLVFAFLAAPVRAENEGQADLDKAVQLKVAANTMSEVTEVIRLTESALGKGLDKANTEFANNLLAAALVQRGSAVCSAIFDSHGPDPHWPQFRKLALADLERGLQLRPKQAQALLEVAKLNRLPDGDEKRAAEAIDEAIKQSGDDRPLHAAALVLRAGIRKDPADRLADLDEAIRLAPSDPDAFRARAAVHADGGKLDAALADLDKSIALDPKHMLTYELKASLLLKMKKFDEALAALEKAHEMSPGSALPLVQRARIFGLQTNMKAALAELDKAHDVEPGNLAVLLLRAAVLQELNEKAKALADIDRVLELKPDLAEAIRLRIVLLITDKKYDEAIIGLEKLRQQNPRDEAILLQLGEIYHLQKKYDKAVEIYSAGLTEHPDEWQFLRARGDAQLNWGHRAEAIADFDKALTMQPKDSGILNNLAWVLATAPEDKLRDGKRALLLATEACQQTEYKQDYILSTLAAAYAETGDFASAEKWAAKAVELSTKDRDELKKELASYQAHKPWRESLPQAEDKKEPKKEEKKPEEKKPDQKKPEDKNPEDKKPEEKKS